MLNLMACMHWLRRLGQSSEAHQPVGLALITGTSSAHPFMQDAIKQQEQVFFDDFHALVEGLVPGQHATEGCLEIIRGRSLPNIHFFPDVRNPG